MKRSGFETILGAVVLVVALGFLSFSAKMGNFSSGGGYTIHADFTGIGGLQIGESTVGRYCGFGSPPFSCDPAGERVKEHLVLTRYNPDRVNQGQMLSVEDVEEILSIELLGVIPESLSVLEASNQGVPVILNNDSVAGLAYKDLVARFLGEALDHRFLTSEKKGLLKRLFGG